MKEFGGSGISHKLTDDYQAARGNSFVQALDLHSRGVAGDTLAVKESVAEFQKMHDIDPADNLIYAYLGSATALLGRDEPNPMEKMKYANQGLKILDQAVANEPENIEIRNLRFNVCYRLPEPIFQRGSTVVEDLNYLVQRYEEDPVIFTIDYYHHILYTLGMAYKTINSNQEAETVWSRLLALEPDRKYIKLLKKQGFNTKNRPTDSGVGALPDDSISGLKPAQPNLTAALQQDTRPNSSQSGKTLVKSRTRSKSKKAESGSFIPPEGLKLYRKALAGNQEAAKKGAAFFEEAWTENPQNKMLSAIHSDCMSLIGRYSQDTFKLFSSAINGIKAFDALLTEDPENIELRFLRAYHSFRLPEAFFKRSAMAITDFEYLLAGYEKNPALFAVEVYWQLLLDLGVAYERMGQDEDAVKTYTKLLSLRPNARFVEIVNHRQNNMTVSTNRVDLSVHNPQGFYQEAARLHELGLSGNKKAARLALEMWEEAAETYPDDAIAQGYYGSSMALVGRDASDPQQMFGNGLRGLKIIRQACSMEPNNLDLRRMRAFVLNALPESFFHLSSEAIKDFQSLASAYQENQKIFPREVYHEILFQLGMAYERISYEEKARKTWQVLLNESNNPKYRELLKERMKDKDEVAL